MDNDVCFSKILLYQTVQTKLELTNEFVKTFKHNRYLLTGEQYSYCKRDDRPSEGVYKRLPIYPWWYYSCEGDKVKCHPCPSTKDLDHPTLFFSERCQQCISEYKGKRDKSLNSLVILWRTFLYNEKVWGNINIII